MVEQPFANRQVCDDIDPELVEGARWADAGAHEESRTAIDPRGEDEFVRFDDASRGQAEADCS